MTAPSNNNDHTPISPAVYATPTSDLEPEYACEYQILARLKRQQSFLLCVFFALVIPPFIFWAIWASGFPRIPMFAFLIPSVVAGFTIKFLARPFSMVARIIPSLIVAGIVALAFTLQQITVYSFFMPFFSFLICLAVSRRMLSFEEEAVLYKVRLGKLK